MNAKRYLKLDLLEGDLLGKNVALGEALDFVHRAIPEEDEQFLDGLKLTLQARLSGSGGHEDDPSMRALFEEVVAEQLDIGD